jgi:hypothetical protein
VSVASSAGALCRFRSLALEPSLIAGVGVGPQKLSGFPAIGTDAATVLGYPATVPDTIMIALSHRCLSPDRRRCRWPVCRRAGLGCREGFSPCDGVVALSP